MCHVPNTVLNALNTLSIYFKYSQKFYGVQTILFPNLQMRKQIRETCPKVKQLVKSISGLRSQLSLKPDDKIKNVH